MCGVTVTEGLALGSGTARGQEKSTPGSLASTSRCTAPRSLPRQNKTCHFAHLIWENVPLQRRRPGVGVRVGWGGWRGRQIIFLPTGFTRGCLLTAPSPSQTCIRDSTCTHCWGPSNCVKREHICLPGLGATAQMLPMPGLRLLGADVSTFQLPLSPVLSSPTARRTSGLGHRDPQKPDQKRVLSTPPQPWERRELDGPQLTRHAQGPPKGRLGYLQERIRGMYFQETGGKPEPW